MALSWAARSSAWSTPASGRAGSSLPPTARWTSPTGLASWTESGKLVERFRISTLRGASPGLAVPMATATPTSTTTTPPADRTSATSAARVERKKSFIGNAPQPPMMA